MIYNDEILYALSAKYAVLFSTSDRSCEEHVIKFFIVATFSLLSFVIVYWEYPGLSSDFE